MGVRLWKAWDVTGQACAVEDNDGARLQLVVPRTWTGQEPVDMPLPIAAEAPRQLGAKSGSLNCSCSSPHWTQVFAGSLHNDLSSTGSFLGLSLPIRRSRGWTQLFEEGHIASDGFVRPEKRRRVGGQDPEFTWTCSTFTESPVTQVRQLYEARHLGPAMRQAPVARLLGVSRFQTE